MNKTEHSISQTVFSRRQWRQIFSIAIILVALASVTPAQDKKDKKRKQRKSAPEAQVVILETETKPLVIPVEPPQRPANGSLFSASSSSGSLFTDFIASNIGDLIFINVVETTEATVSSSAERSRDSGTLGGIGTAAGTLPVPGAAAVGTVFGALGRRNYEGNGSTQRNSDIRSRITARVVEVLPNGDFRVEALKLVRINKETEQLALSGIVRRVDLAGDNSIPSTRIGDLRIDLNGKGIASRDNAPGWLFRFFDKVSPF